MCGKVVEIFKASEKRTAIFLSVYDFGLDESTTISMKITIIFFIKPDSKVIYDIRHEHGFVADIYFQGRALP